MNDPTPPELREAGSPAAARLASIVVIVLIGVVAVIQQLGGSALERTPAEAADTATVAPPSAEFEFTAKLFTKIAMSDKGGVLNSMFIQQVRGAARTPEDKIRAAIIAGELASRESAVEELRSAEESLPPESPLRDDAAAVEDLYAGGEAAPDAEALRALRERHGWFGRLAAARARGPDDPELKRMLGGGETIVLLLLGGMLVGGAAFVAGSILLVLAFVHWRQSPPPTRFVPRPPGGSLLIETVAVFVAGFLALKLFSALVEYGLGPGVAGVFAMAAQWLLGALIVWPRYRGLPLHRALFDLGLHRGRGVLREIGWGIVGYVACLPILVTGAMVSMVLIVLYGAARAAMGRPEPPPPSNPVVDIVAEQRGSWMIVLLFLLASLWAPLVEETVFRGALYGHLRQRWHWAFAAIVTALAFGLMHGYQILMLGGVIALGFGFALLREWRGTLIPCMTAHCIHNAGVLVILLTIMRLLAD